MNQGSRQGLITYQEIKSFLDRFLAVLLLPILLILTPLICLAIVINSPGSPFFFQRRVGANGHEFMMFKFRTMRLDTPNVSTAELQALGIDPITRVGYFLRRSSLDELPQIMNILLGEMSFVGPRPALPSQYDVLELRRQLGADHLVPGITGLAQVRGRDDLAPEQKCALDVQYAKDISVVLDFRILFVETFGAVLSNRGNK